MRTAHALTPLAGLLLAAAAPAWAQPPAPAPAPAVAALPAVGAVVRDVAGGAVGTVVSADAAAVIIDTGANRVALAPASFAFGPAGPVITPTRAELDAGAAAALAEAVAATSAAIVRGAAVSGPEGAAFASVEAVEGDLVTVKSGAVLAKLPRAAFALDPARGLIIAMTAAELKAAVAGAK